jgi:hypothetical protein
MELPIPAWFKYRQGEAKPAGDHSYQLTAPLVDPTWIRTRQKEGAWQAAIADSADGPDLMTTGPIEGTEMDAWHAAFELYRVAKIN